MPTNSKSNFMDLGVAEPMTNLSWSPDMSESVRQHRQADPHRHDADRRSRTLTDRGLNGVAVGATSRSDPAMEFGVGGGDIAVRYRAAERGGKARENLGKSGLPRLTPPGPQG